MTTCSSTKAEHRVRAWIVFVTCLFLGACGGRDGGAVSDSGHPSPDGGACRPYCGEIGTANEGWYDGCDHTLLTNPRGSEPLSDSCAGCDVTCDEIGTRSEGWYTNCNDPVLWAHPIRMLLERRSAYRTAPAATASHGGGRPSLAVML
jgi:hypothetical protein